MTPDGRPFILYSHKDKKTLFNDGHGNHPFYVFLHETPLARYGEDCVVNAIQPHIILAHKDNLYRGGAFDEILNDLYNGLTEDSNPVLFFYYINNQL